MGGPDRGIFNAKPDQILIVTIQQRPSPGRATQNILAKVSTCRAPVVILVIFPSLSLGC
jgi:hypothetical protein